MALYICLNDTNHLEMRKSAVLTLVLSVLVQRVWDITEGVSLILEVLRVERLSQKVQPFSRI